MELTLDYKFQWWWSSWNESFNKWGSWERSSQTGFSGFCCKRKLAFWCQ